MTKRTICIQNPCKMSVRHHSLQIESDSGKASVPLEDIWVVVAETHQATITSAALAAFSDAGIGLVTCGSDHMPNGLHLPLGSHSRHAAIVEHQLLMAKPLRKQLWQRIVKTKIANQALCLKHLGLPGESELMEYAKDVLSGDSSGREAVAAGFYFKRYLPDGTRRDGSYTAALDYGYAILRAGIGRAAVAGGWLVSRGIHHDNDLNAFNLVDDLIEPFRPIIDIMVARLPRGAVLDSNNKALLAAVFEQRVVMGEDSCTVQTAITRMLNSLRKSVVRKDASLLELPRLLA